MFSHRNTRRQTQKSPVKRFLFVFGLVFFLMYLGLGLMIIFWKTLPLPLSRNQRLALGIILIVYSFIRFYRLWQKQNDRD
ncbi:hypothetical protein FUA48_06815 [Flavobacterium alkalisoli]|uniref:Uncharacterized protein n=1 Tax=Flavobacterium alkalisoli TaxID=2602769 RepID=A0A5B9FT13_9FLAO|nr:hypothetical protein FUA48_06815 [Flavobacterium alkalisoli]